jgi:hypothetical protein
MTSTTLASGVIAVSLALLAPASIWAAPGDPACAPDKTLPVTFEARESGRSVPLVATHELTVVAEWEGEVRQPTLSVPAGIRVLRTQPRQLRLIVPSGASLPVTASWEQATDPSDPESDLSDPATRCVGGQTVALPVTPAKPPRSVYDPGGRRPDIASLAVVADRSAADLSPLEVSVRLVTAARFPSAKSKARTMPVAMRPSERVRYRKHIPRLDAFLGLVESNRLYNLSRGPGGRLFTSVSTLGGVSYRNGRVVERSLDGGEYFPPAQPYRHVASDGVRINVSPFYIPRPSDPLAFEHGIGYDVQVHQSGRLVGRLRRAIRWGQTPRGRFYHHVVRAKNG